METVRRGWEFKTRCKLQLGILDYADIDDSSEDFSEILNTIVAEWWPADNFERKKDWVKHFNTPRLMKYAEVPYIHDELARRFRSSSQDEMRITGWYSKVEDTALPQSLQNILSEREDWWDFRHFYCSDLKVRLFKTRSKTIQKLIKEASPYQLSEYMEEAAYIPNGGAISAELFRAALGSSDHRVKDMTRIVTGKASLEVIKESWPGITEMNRPLLLNRADIPETWRKTGLRCLLRRMGNNHWAPTITAQVPWDWLRGLPDNCVLAIPKFVKLYRKLLTGEPILLEEFKHLAFRGVMKGDRVEFERAIAEYDKLHIGAEEAAMIAERMEEINRIQIKEVKAWMDACGTETSKELAFLIVTEPLPTFSSSKQAKILKQIEAEPRDLFTFLKKPVSEESREESGY